MEESERKYFSTIEEWRAWLKQNHKTAKYIAVIRYKKHTGVPSPSHLEFMHEAICWGWIDTTVKRVNEETYIVNFRPRNKNSNWSTNTLKYGKQMIKEGRMSDHGLLHYKIGMKKGAYNIGIEKDPSIPDDLKEAFKENKLAEENFMKLAPSYRRMALRWLLSAKLSETRKKRVATLVALSAENKKIFG